MDSTLGAMSTYMRNDRFPHDLLGNTNPLTLIIFIPLVDNFLYPSLRKIGFKMRPVTRITIGFCIGVLAMAYCAIIQVRSSRCLTNLKHFLYKSPPYYEKVDEGQKNEFSLYWQIPAFVLIGLSEIFAGITGLEYAYTKAPSSMKSLGMLSWLMYSDFLVMSIFLFMTAIGSIFELPYAPLAKNPLFIWIFIIVAIIASIAAIVFWFFFKHLNEEDDQLNSLDKTSTNLPTHMDERQDDVV